MRASEQIKDNRNGHRVLDASGGGTVTDLTTEKPKIDVGDMDKMYEGILRGVGEDPTREGLLKTPYRAAAAMKFLTQGYTQDLNVLLNNAIFNEENNNMVVLRDIEFHSLCEHHLLPFYGKCHVAYIPNGKIVGVSKLARIVDMFARRLQVQERMTRQIADTLMEHLNPHGVAIVTEARHMCMMMRGVEKQNSVTTASAMFGAFKDPRTRSEFMTLIGSRLS